MLVARRAHAVDERLTISAFHDRRVLLAPLSDMVDGWATVVNFLDLSDLHALQELGTMIHILGARAHLRLYNFRVVVCVGHFYRVNIGIKDIGHGKWRQVVLRITTHLGDQFTLPRRQVIKALPRLLVVLALV